MRDVLHTTWILESPPGTFEFTSKQVPDFESRLALANPADGQCLLLCTLTLTQAALLINSEVLTAGLELTSRDACYSVITLFHIGGLSASILCTLVAGGSVYCNNMLYNARRMVEVRALSRPRPTWHLAVITIHNTMFAFIRDDGGREPRLDGYEIKGGVWGKGHGLRLIR